MSDCFYIASPAVFDILDSSIGVTSLTFRGHVTSSVTWPLDYPYLTLDLSSSRTQVTLGHMSTPNCLVVFSSTFFGFFPVQVHILEVSFDDVHPVLPWSSCFSLVTRQFPLCCLTSCSGVVHSQDLSKPSGPSFHFSWTSCLSDVFISDLIPPYNPNRVSSGTYGELLLFFYHMCDRQWPWFCIIQ